MIIKLVSLAINLDEDPILIAVSWLSPVKSQNFIPHYIL